MNYKSVIPRFLNLFDVSLRDSIQTWKRIPSLNEKKTILNNIVNNTPVKKIELGSVVSKKIYPQFNDSIELYHYCFKNHNHITPYLLIPNSKMQDIALFNNISNMSFITSVSDEFQKKNINMSLSETKEEIKKMINNTKGFKKLYISCVHECPLSGSLDSYTIANEIIEYIDLPVNEICLSDTCGTLTKDILESIFSLLLPVMIIKNIPISKLSLHLHKNKNSAETDKIIKYCISEYMFNFDVSYIEGGGCTLTIDKKNLNDNLHYNNFINY